jgi:ubiquinone/menaquinone biosynthesis C-methylase UbiE
VKFKSMRLKQAEDARNKILSCESLLMGNRFLDVGCGDGELTMNFEIKLGAKEVYGIDNDEQYLSKARSRGVNTKCVDINSGMLPFPNNFFDVVLCHQVAEHLMDVDHMMQEVWRVLKLNGGFLISVPNLCSLHNRLFMLAGYQPTVVSPSNKFSFGNSMQGEQLEESVGHRHNKAFSPRAFKEMIKYYGFKIEHYWGSGIYFLPEFILKVFPELGVVQIILARKAND